MCRAVEYHASENVTLAFELCKLLDLLHFVFDKNKKKEKEERLSIQCQDNFMYRIAFIDLSFLINTGRERLIRTRLIRSST